MSRRNRTPDLALLVTLADVYLTMSEPTKSGYRWLLWFGAVILLTAAVIVIVMSSSPTKPVNVIVTVGRNGIPLVGGVPLLSTNIRDTTFSAMSAVGLKARLVVPTLTNNDLRESNVLETLKSMSRAGLFGTNQKPNPYE